MDTINVEAVGFPSDYLSDNSGKFSPGRIFGLGTCDLTTQFAHIIVTRC